MGCPSCGVAVPESSLGSHLVSAHLGSRGDGWECGRCPFAAHDFDGISAHCLETYHNARAIVRRREEDMIRLLAETQDRRRRIDTHDADVDSDRGRISVLSLCKRRRHVSSSAHFTDHLTDHERQSTPTVEPTHAYFLSENEKIMDLKYNFVQTLEGSTESEAIDMSQDICESKITKMENDEDCDPASVVDVHIGTAPEQYSDSISDSGADQSQYKFQFSISKVQWNLIADGARPTGTDKWVSGGHTWRQHFLREIAKSRPYCNLKTSGVHFQLRSPSVEKWGRGPYARCTLTCQGQLSDSDQLCGIKYKVSLHDRPDREDPFVVFDVEQVDGDSEKNHTGADGKTKPKPFRRRLQGQQRAKKKAELRKTPHQPRQGPGRHGGRSSSDWQPQRCRRSGGVKSQRWKPVPLLNSEVSFYGEPIYHE